jgi:hypothetical protein
MRKMTLSFVFVMFVLMLMPREIRSCTSYLVSKGATTDGSTLISYAGDSHVRFGNLYFFPRATWPEGSTITIYDRSSGKPLGQIPQPRETYQVIGFMNEHQVAVGESTFGGRSELEDSIRLYYAYVDSAEVCFICGDYANSVAYYKTAFTYHKVPFISDMVAASFASKRIDAHSSTVIDYHVENSQRGRKYWFKSDEKGYNDSIKAIYDSTPSLVNAELRAELVTMFDLDQGIRRLSDRMYDYLYNDSIKPIIDLIDSLNLRRILQLYQKYPLINDRLPVGIFTRLTSGSSFGITILKNNCFRRCLMY